MTINGVNQQIKNNYVKDDGAKKQNVQGEDVQLFKKANAFDEWNSDDNLKKYLSGENVDDFEMFDAVGEKMSTEEYVGSLVDFSQEYLNKYDENKDGVWSQEEFFTMAQGGVKDTLEYVDSLDESGILNQTEKEALAQQYNALFDKLFDDFQMNDDIDTISADEFASQLFMSDINQNGNVDGKVDFLEYNTFANITGDVKDYVADVADRKFMYNEIISPENN